MSHTILLVQPGVRPETRTYSDYESINECMEGVCKIYEEHLKRRNPNTPTITYDISQLFDFVDQLTDLSCLVYQKSTNTYAPYNKDWIKEKIYVLLRRAAGHDADVRSYRLIIASNRDETYKRPASSAHYWDKYPECLGGIDMEPGKEGGTWLGISVKGKAGIILNLINEDATDSPKKGRGFLITNFITSNDSIDSYLNKLHEENINGQSYNPYCLVLLNLINANVHYLSNCTKSTGPIICNNDIIGIGNSGLNHPYKKVEIGKEEFKNIIQDIDISKQDDLIEKLICFLKSKKKYLPDAELQKRHPAIYKELSSIFVSGKEYGTRTHSLLLLDGSNHITFVEETLMPDFTWKRQQFQDEILCDNMHILKKKKNETVHKVAMLSERAKANENENLTGEDEFNNSGTKRSQKGKQFDKRG